MDFNNPTLVKIVGEVSRSVSSKFPSYISRDDTEQNIWLWVIKNKRSVSKLMRDNESWEPMVRATITRVANSDAFIEDAAVNGYSTDDAFFYTTKAIKKLLPDSFDHEDWQSFASKADGLPKSKGLANETGDRMAMLADIRNAMKNLSDDQYNLIVWVYKYGWTYTALGAELGISGTAAKSRVERAVGALQKALGGPSIAQLRHSDRKEERRIMGTAESIAVMERNYEG